MAYFIQPGSHPQADHDQTFLASVFQRIDTDRNGSINAAELEIALTKGGWKPFNPETIRLMIQMFDRDNSGTISFNEFGALWNHVTVWVKSFKLCDWDNSGTLDRGELTKALFTSGYRLSQLTADMMLRKYDKNGKRTLAVDDFIQCCMLLQTSTNTFKQKHTNEDGAIQINYDEFLQMVMNVRM